MTQSRIHASWSQRNRRDIAFDCRSVEHSLDHGPAVRAERNRSGYIKGQIEVFAQIQALLKKLRKKCLLLSMFLIALGFMGFRLLLFGNFHHNGIIFDVGEVKIVPPSTVIGGEVRMRGLSMEGGKTHEVNSVFGDKQIIGSG